MPWVTRPVANIKYLYAIHVNRVTNMILHKFYTNKLRCTTKKLISYGVPHDLSDEITKAAISLHPLLKHAFTKAPKMVAKQILGEDTKIRGATDAMRAELTKRYNKMLLEINVELTDMCEQYERMVDLHYRDGKFKLDREHQRLANTDYKSVERLEQRYRDRIAAGIITYDPTKPEEGQ